MLIRCGLILALGWCHVHAGERDAPAAEENAALGKRVVSHVPVSDTYGRAAARLTDGQADTDAYPGAFRVDYEVDLQAYTEEGLPPSATAWHVRAIVIDWGKYGRHFPGAKRPDGTWVPAAYKADYVQDYTVSVRQRGANQAWTVVHAHQGRPTDETGDGIGVTRTPANATSSEGEVRTRLDGLDLHDVTGIRIKARGGHWIGIRELEVFGTPESTDTP